MHLISHLVEYRGDPTFNIWDLSDAHIGTKHHDKQLFLKDINRIAADPNALWIGGGDNIEAIPHGDKRHAPIEIAEEFTKSEVPLITAQKEAFVEAVRPIVSKNVGIHSGNHELTIQNIADVDVTRDICKELGAKELSDTAFIRFVFHRLDDEGNRNKTYTLMVYSEHGACNATTSSGVTTYLENLMREFDAEVYFTGHCHRKVQVEHPQLAAPRKGNMALLAKSRIALSSGCYYQTYLPGLSSYGQRKSFKVTTLGMMGVSVRPLMEEVKVID